MSRGRGQRGQLPGGSAARHLLILLALGITAYAGVKTLYQRIDAGLAERPVATPAAGATNGYPGPADPRAADAGADRETILSRNVFLGTSADSRADNGAQLAGGLQPEASLVLVGTIVEEGGERLAVVFDVGRKEQFLVREGDEINGASVTHITPGKAVISRRGRMATLDIVDAVKLREAGRAGSADMSELAAGADTGEADVEADPETGIEAGQEVETGPSASVRVDLDRLGEAVDSIIIKGRISNDI